ncbi:hypothetical protein FACS1894154_11230 [Betaproteobacteria bacterium]|nr:hypothetical protein FACS1894154_11230 [Betaproteobacteria bacterium]GHU12713.1 hypothetical protein AGMMS50225_21220 [Betaproteobacteria bacterium]GHU21946.1 hypothetical protein FACS189488_01510 [Betaproteobacteria bacterium]
MGFPDSFKRFVPSLITSSAWVQGERYESAAEGNKHDIAWVDVDDYLIRQEANPRKAAALARARKRLATDAPELYPAGALRTLRLQKGLSQKQLAARMGTSQSRLSRIEAGQDDPLLSTVRKLAQALDVSVEMIVAALDVHLPTIMHEPQSQDFHEPPSQPERDDQRLGG